MYSDLDSDVYSHVTVTRFDNGQITDKEKVNRAVLYKDLQTRVIVVTDEGRQEISTIRL